MLPFKRIPFQAGFFYLTASVCKQILSGVFFKQSDPIGNSLLILSLNLRDLRHAKPVTYLQFPDKEKRAFQTNQSASCRNVCLRTNRLQRAPPGARQNG